MKIHLMWTSAVKMTDIEPLPFDESLLDEPESSHNSQQ
jgi:hypothetical protein